MKALSKIGRFLFAVPFLAFGFFHLTNAGQMAGLISNFPLAEALVYFSGLALLLAGVSIVINKKAQLATQLVALLLLIIILSIHIPAVAGGDQMAMTSLLKDIGLLGAALTYSGVLKN